MQNFKVILKKENQKKYALISWIIVSVNAICLFLLSSTTGFKDIRPVVGGAIVILLALLLRYLKPANEKTTLWGPIFLCSLAWGRYNLWISIADLVFMALSLQATKDLVINFSEEEIKYIPFFPKRISWTEVSNVILKDDMLTIDLKNNKIIQQQVDERSSSINEKEFNDFCSRQLTISNQKQTS